MKFDKSKISKIRDECDLTLEEFAKRIGVTKQAAAFWEVGQTKPRSDMIGKMCDVFNKKPNYFYREE